MGYSPWGCKESNTTERLHRFTASLGFPGDASGKESACQWRCRRRGLDPWVGKIPWRRKWQPTAVDRGAWWAAAREAAEGWTQLSTARGGWGSGEEPDARAEHTPCGRAESVLGLPLRAALSLAQGTVT